MKEILAQHCFMCGYYLGRREKNGCIRCLQCNSYVKGGFINESKNKS